MELQEILEKSKKLRTSLDKLIEVILERKDLFALISTNWRVKDVLAHISWHEREMENLIGNMSLKGSEYWLLPLNERNEKIFQEFFDIDENNILNEYKQSFVDMMEEMKQMNPEASTNAKLFAEMPLDWDPWKVIAGNTFEHYEGHIKQLQNSFAYLN